MEVRELIDKIKEFFELFYFDKILAKARKGEKSFQVDFSDLLKFDSELGEMVLDDPEELLKCFDLAVKELGFELRVRFFNLPLSSYMLIRNIRSKDIGKFVAIEGVVRQKSDVRPQVTAARFECPSCGNVINVLQLDTSFKEPNRCSCGRKGRFRLLGKELVDAQGLVLEELPEYLEGGEQPKRIKVFLKDDLVSPMTEKRTNPGSRIVVIGVIKEVPIVLRGGVKSTRYDLMVEANNVEFVEEDFYSLEITKEEEEQIKELAKDEYIYDKLVESIAPSIYGYEKMKEALVLQLFGGVRKTRKDGVVSRGDIHILLIGDPGAGKSALLKRMALVAPKARYVSGKGATGAGLTASVTRDEFLKGWSLEAGAMVLANGGLCAIDELDKMSQEDRAAMHEGLENQTITISKANIQATLIARTTVLAAANPKFGRFDPYDIIAKQIDLPPTLINRFDLIFPVKDLPEEKKDELLAGHILKLHQRPDLKEGAISTKLLRKYIAYARQRVRPVLTDAALEEIKRYYVEMRNKAGEAEGGMKAIPISPRQLEALVRLAEASAKIRLSDKVERKDARRAIDLLHYCLTQVGIDPQTGKIDIDKIATGVTASQRNRIVLVKEIIEELENRVGKQIPIEDVLREALRRKISESDVEEAIEKLKRVGDIFEPRRGFIQRI